jgi:hypothetical protein
MGNWLRHDGTVRQHRARTLAQEGEDKKINETAMKDPSSGFELSCMYSRYRRQALAVQMLGADDICSERVARSNGPAAPQG